MAETTETTEVETAEEAGESSDSAPTGAVARASASDIAAWAGHRLDEIGGANVGKIDGVFVDESTGEPEWLLARMGRFGHHTLVPARDAVEGVKHVWVPYSRDQIRRGPKANTSAPLTAGAERELLAHYGIMAEVGRGAAIAERDDDEVTARPA